LSSGIKKIWFKKRPAMIYVLMTVNMLLCSLAGNAQAVGKGIKITYGGLGAGEVVFDGTVHAAKRLTCADCHEGHGFQSALFEKKRGVNTITMNKIERGRSCGACHDVSPNDTRGCEKCHHK